MAKLVNTVGGLNPTLLLVSCEAPSIEQIQGQRLIRKVVLNMAFCWYRNPVYHRENWHSSSCVPKAFPRRWLRLPRHICSHLHGYNVQQDHEHDV